MSLQGAFDATLRMKQRPMTITRTGVDGFEDLEIMVSPANYFRNGAAVEDTVVAGREFVVSTTSLTLAGIEVLRRGDRITDPLLGLIIIVEVEPMFGLGSTILGWRIRSA